jgi:hypothetical protein
MIMIIPEIGMITVGNSGIAALTVMRTTSVELWPAPSRTVRVTS